jgi:anthranilate synthase component 2
MRILLIDNYDSFTYNLKQLCDAMVRSSDDHVVVRRNNEIDTETIIQEKYDRIIISPGPGSPTDEAYFGICAQILREVSTYIPTLGVCLGMQGIASVYGGRVVRCEEPMHGKTSMIIHDGRGIFAQIPNLLSVMRYHSLSVEAETLPACLQVTAYASSASDQCFIGNPGNDAVIMGLRHRTYPIVGVQFHPESFASQAGGLLMQNFLYHTV